jgi:HAD superfamily hydrolase (TIGR01509 family)
VELPLFPSVLFDFDGTLVDSSPLHDAAYREVLARHRPELLPHFRYDSVKGRATSDALAALGVREAELAFLTAAKQQAYRDMLFRLELLPGAREVLDALHATGSAMFLVTSGSRASVVPALQATGIEPFFRGVTTGDDVLAGKPAPEPYRCCLRRHGLRPHRCVAVEDSMNGVVSARKAGLSVIGVHDPDIAPWVDEFFPSLPDFEYWIHSTAARGAVS